MLSTNLIKKGCLTSFVTLFFVLVLVYFLVYKTLVYTEDSFANQEWDKLQTLPITAPAADLVTDMVHSEGGEACNATDGKMFAGVVTNDPGRGGGCTSIADETLCNSTLRVKKKYKVKNNGKDKIPEGCDTDSAVNCYAVGDEIRNESDIAFLTGTGNGEGVYYGANANIYPCKWDPTGGDTGTGKCKNDYDKRCVIP